VLRLDLSGGRRLPALVLEFRVWLGRPAAAGPLDVHGRVYRDPPQPALHAPAAKRSDVSIGAQKRLLDGVGGLIAIRDEPVDKREQVILVAHDQLVECRELAADRLTDEGNVDLLAGVLDPAGFRVNVVGHDSPISHVDTT
jgi:hypothetical protein